jgi:hypothetical protein
MSTFMRVSLSISRKEREENVEGNDSSGLIFYMQGELQKRKKNVQRNKAWGKLNFLCDLVSRA